MSKILWFDTETGGVDPVKNPMIQIAGMIEVDGEIVNEFNYLMRPFPGDALEQGALDVNKRTAEEINKFPLALPQIGSLQRLMGRHVNKFNKQDKFVMAGFNVGFDEGFLRRTFAKCGDKYFGSWFFNCPLDVRTVVGMALVKHQFRLKNYKLVTVCDHFGVKLGDDAHDAMADIRATRELYYTILKMLGV